MVNYFTFNYKLKTRDDDGNLVDFSPLQTIYNGHVVADSLQEAVSKLEDSYHMMTVEILSSSPMKSMTDEEYEHGDVSCMPCNGLSSF